MSEVTNELGRAGLSQRFFAWFMSLGDSPRYANAVDGHKRRLFGALAGTVVEIGPGLGDNFAYFPKSINWTGIEPNVYMHPKLKAAAAQHGFEADIRPMVAERLPLDDSSADAVVSTLVFCSVSDQRVALREILRVLKPGGRFVFIEHVAAPQGTGLRRLQRIIRPAWRVVGDGCHPDRETHEAIKQAGFSHVEIEHFAAPLWVASPHIAGVAVK